MATKVFEVETLELQDGTVVEIRPLNIKRLRKFMEHVGKMDKIEDETEAIDIMVDACAVAIDRTNPELAADKEKLEDVLDIPTMWRILEVAGGVKQDPNLAAGLVGKT